MTFTHYRLYKAEAIITKTGDLITHIPIIEEVNVNIDEKSVPKYKTEIE